ncbi:MAG: hypothetical protein E7042_02060 [Lentisphaerae bacterium]|nr:hypothetical protein [Lentisphaerota bacterium]
MDGHKVTLLALGGAGCRIIRRIAGTPGAEKLRLLAMDSDTESLKESGLPAENCIIAGMNLRSGRGCGGNDILGRSAAAVERPRLAKILEGTEILLIIGGLGGGMCSGGLPVILGVARHLHITTMLMLSLPFAMEGYGRRKQADDRICSDLLPLADCLIALPNDLLFSTLAPETPLAQALELADVEMARTAVALSSILLAGNIFSADVATFSALLKPNALCSLGVGVVSTAEGESLEAAVEKMMLSPLLGGPAELQRADAVIFTVIGGTQLSLGSAKSVLDLACSQLDKSVDRKILIGAGSAAAWDGMVQITALTVRYTDKKPETPAVAETPVRRSAAARRNLNPSDAAFVQQTLDLDTDDKGIMENSTPDFFNGEDLDVPTFKRRGIFIDQGK